MVGGNTPGVSAVGTDHSAGQAPRSATTAQADYAAELATWFAAVAVLMAVTWHQYPSGQFAVLVPDLRGLRDYRVRAANVREVADAFRYLVARGGLAPQGRAGIAGFSYGAGPVLLAALVAGLGLVLLPRR